MLHLWKDILRRIFGKAYEILLKIHFRKIEKITVFEWKVNDYSQQA